ncbi:MAG: DNA polymerase IV [Candidatus Cloacimonetes bacterium]|nr:DNA polymerase IV [Candidatus Cloacimonadota bacterium]
MAESERRIIHIDMDAFFAAIEMRDFPQYRGKPLIVGGPPNSRGVVSTCSYEARKYGIHSAMPSYLAYRLCPKAIFISGRYEVYRQVGRQLCDIFFQYTPLVESVSIDEAYLDVTEQTKDLSGAVSIAKEIKNKIREKLQLTGSAGVSYNKFLAKIASEMQKPNGLTLINRENGAKILEELEISKFHGIGKATAEKMYSLDIKTGKDLKKWELQDLLKHFGQVGNYYYKIVRGIDNREVKVSRIRKSLGKERTFSKDLFDPKEMLEILNSIAQDVSESLIRKNIKGKTVSIKIKYNDFTLHTRCLTRQYFFSDHETMCAIVRSLFETNYIRNRGVRLLGVSVSNLDTEEKLDAGEQQLFDFFTECDAEEV